MNQLSKISQYFLTTGDRNTEYVLYFNGRKSFWLGIGMGSENLSNWLQFWILPFECEIAKTFEIWMSGIWIVAVNQSQFSFCTGLRSGARRCLGTGRRPGKCFGSQPSNA